MTRSRRLMIALGLNVVLVLAQLVFGVVANSLGLISDAAHNLTDVAAVLFSLIAVRLARRAPTAERSFGYHRATILAALINASTIFAVTAFIIWEAVHRLANPEPVEGGIVVVVAVAAFVLNAGAAMVLRDRSSDMNMRSALLHMTGDAVASLGVATAGLIMLVTGRFLWLDPAVSMGIAALIAFEAVKLIREATDVLLESTPKDLDVSILSIAIVEVPGVSEVHDLHAWSLSSEVRALSAHLVLSGHPTLEEAQATGGVVKAAIESRFSIAHSTFELECESCMDGAASPCGVNSSSELQSVHAVHSH